MVLHGCSPGLARSFAGDNYPSIVIRKWAGCDKSLKDWEIGEGGFKDWDRIGFVRGIAEYRFIRVGNRIGRRAEEKDVGHSWSSYLNYMVLAWPSILWEYVSEVPSP